MKHRWYCYPVQRNDGIRNRYCQGNQHQYGCGDTNNQTLRVETPGRHRHIPNLLEDGNAYFQIDRNPDGTLSTVTPISEPPLFHTGADPSQTRKPH